MARHSTHHSKRTAIGTVLALLLAMVPALLLTSTAAHAAVDPSQVSFTLEGCRNNGGITLPNGNGDFICADAAYTTGNLGKGWNELDLVPYRVTTGVGSQAGATTDYSIAIAVDHFNSGKIGYDLLSAATVNAAKSNASCSVSNGAQQDNTASLYRILTIHQNKGTTCVFDFYARLAIGAHLYPGSSLHANLFNQALGTSGIGAKEVSIPVKEILPQSIAKTMGAVQGQAYDWTLSKSSTPVTRSLGDTCDPANPLTGGVQVTVTWTRVGPAPAGQILVTTSITATNPASRVITVDVSDAIRSGTTVLDTVSSGPIDVPANSSGFPLLTHSMTVAAGTTNLNDVATATYTDKATGVTVPGTTTATASASVVSSGTTTNATAVITDTETLTGSAFRFRVDSTSGATGTYTGGYVEGTYRTDPLTWTSGTQSGSGSVTFNKTVDVTSATNATGTLSDVADLNASDGLTKTANASTTLNATATVSATIAKSMNQVFAGSKSFGFALFSGTAPGTDTGITRTVTIPAGQLNGSSTAITGLDPTLSYYFEESATAPFPAQTTAGFSYALVAGNLASCSATVNVTNNAAPATARVQKTTVPAGSTSWEFTLTGPNGLSEVKNATAGAGYVDFAATLDVDGGTYTITETAKTDWDNTAVSGDITGNNARSATTSTTTRTCSIVLNLTTDSGAVLSCSFTNTQRGRVTLAKTVSGSPIPSGSPYSFEFTLTGPNSFSSTMTANGTNGGSLDFGSLVPGSYRLCENQTGAGWSATWSVDGSPVTPFNPDAQDIGTRCVNITLAAGATVAVAVDNVPPPGGGQRTIGYWKNWNSEKRSAAFLAKHHATHAIVDDFIGPTGNPGTVMLGNVTVNTVAKAVTILSDASTKYAEHGLAAQLLAAKLNVLAGAAPSCTTIAGVISTADAMLVSIGWSDANYSTSKIVGSGYNNGTYTRAQIVATHATLDAYNNGTCPS